MSDILDLIDGAIEDWLSEDAMRWAPDDADDAAIGWRPTVVLNDAAVRTMAAMDVSLTPRQEQVLASLAPGTLTVTLDNRDAVFRPHPIYGAGEWRRAHREIFEWSPGIEVIDEAYAFTREYLNARVAEAFGVPVGLTAFTTKRWNPLRRARLRRMHGAYRARRGRQW
jgi:hypothetical protein